MMLDIQLKNGHYLNTTQLAADFRKMIHCKFKIYSVSGTTEMYNQVQEFYMIFEQGYKGLEDLPLVLVKESSNNKQSSKADLKNQKGMNKQKSIPNMDGKNK